MKLQQVILVDSFNASLILCDDPQAKQMLGSSRQSIVACGQSSPPNSAPILANRIVESASQASLGRLVECIAPMQAYALNEACFVAAQTIVLACLLHLAQNVTRNFTFGPTLWSGGNRLAIAWGHVPISWPILKELDSQDCSWRWTECLGSFRSTKEVGADYLTSSETEFAIEEIAKDANRNDIVAKSVLQVLNDRVGWTSAMLINVLDPVIISLASSIAKLNRLYVNVSCKRPGYASKGKSATDLVWITKNEDASEPAKVSTQKWQEKTT